jgi:hypothetical protein
MSDRLRSALRWESGLALVVLIIGVVGVTVSAQFLTSNNLFNVGLSYGEIAIMTLPMTLIIISGRSTCPWRPSSACAAPCSVCCGTSIGPCSASSR